MAQDPMFNITYGLFVVTANAGGRDNAPRSSGPESGNVAAQDPAKKKSSGHRNRHRRKPGGGQAKPEKAE